MSMISYAQNREDVLLHRAFPTPAGFYLDVGAADPVEYSVTKWFYDRGWSGINVEPQPGYFAALQADRPRDTNLNVGLSDRPGTVTLYEAPDRPGWSTMEPAVADGFLAQGIELVEREVAVLTLAEVCERYARGPIDFLKIDVEGFEPHVLRGADFARWRPRVVLVEATEVGRPVLNHDGWEPLLLDADYRFATFDGLNRYYVRAEDEDLVEKLRVPANVFDDFVPWEWLSARNERDRDLATVRDQLATVTRDRDAEKARADHYLNAFECRTKEADNHKATADYYVTAFECRTQEAEALKKQLEAAAAERDRWREGAAELKKQLEAAAAERDRWREGAAELDTVRDRLAAAERTVARLRTAYDAAVALLGQARAHADSLRSEVLRAAVGE
jgi:FkbM family methyltransferase